MASVTNALLDPRWTPRAGAHYFHRLMRESRNLLLDQVLNYLTLAEEHVTSTSIQSAGFTLGAVGSQKMKRWEADYVLEELDKLHLFDEYIEMSECKNKSFLYF